MKRREFITLLGGAAAAWPLTARAQQPQRMRRIGVISTLPADDREGTTRNTAFLQTLQELGWTDGRNVRIEIRWGAGNPERIRKFVGELVALKPDVVLATGVSTVGPLQQVTRTLPIVFVQVTDPGDWSRAWRAQAAMLPASRCSNTARGGKWLELLKQIAPGMSHVAVLRDQARQTGLGQFVAIQSAAAALGIELRPVGVRDAGEIARGVSALAQFPNGGLIVTTGAYALLHRELILALAARHRLPATYP
jgi:ABC-type uncharacterized transport system substrate-binding protein